MRLNDFMAEAAQGMLLYLISGIVLLGIIIFVDMPLYTRGIEVEKRVIEEGKRLATLINTGNEYITVKNDVENLRERSFRGDGSALSGLDAIVNQAGLKKKLATMKPVSSHAVSGMKKVKADLSIQKVSIPEVSGFIDLLEQDAHPFSIEKLSMKVSYENPALFNISMTISTVEKEAL